LTVSALRGVRVYVKEVDAPAARDGSFAGSGPEVTASPVGSDDVKVGVTTVRGVESDWLTTVKVAVIVPSDTVGCAGSKVNESMAKAPESQNAGSAPDAVPGVPADPAVPGLPGVAEEPYVLPAAPAAPAAGPIPAVVVSPEQVTAGAASDGG
jgi:hypothetical protein